MKNKLKSILSIEIPILYLKKTLALVLLAGIVLTNGDYTLLGHTVVEAAASSFKANDTSVDLDTPEPWQTTANAEKNITDKSGVSQSVLGKAWLYGVVANEWTFDGESETNFAVKTLSGKAGHTGVTDVAEGALSAESMVGESTTNGVVQIKGDKEKRIKETLTLPKGQESKFSDACGGLIYKYDTKQNIEAAIDAMRRHVEQQSIVMAQKNSIPDYSKVAYGDTANKITLDFTESGEGTIYVNVDQWVGKKWEANQWKEWSLSQAFQTNGAITIKKKSNQIIVFNFSGSEVNLNQMIIEEDGKTKEDGNAPGTVDIANTTSSSNDIIEGLYFNMPNAKQVHLQDSAGIFIAPNATVTTGGVGGGWVICDKFINGCEWHFTNGKLPDTYGKDSVQFHAVKNIAGKPADKDGFTFTLSEKDENNSWKTIQTKTNKGSAIDFDSIEYKYDTKNPDQEVKLYRISEEDKQTLNGVTYNTEKTAYYARVTLDKTSAAGQGNSNNYGVKASVAYYKDEACSQLIDTETPVFNNTEANGSLLVLKSVSGPEGFELTDAQKQAIVFTVSDSSGATIASFTYKNMLDKSGVTLPYGSVVKVTYEKGGVKLSNLTPGSYTVSENVDQANDVAGYAHTTTVTVDGKEETTNSRSVKVESAKDASIAFKNSYAQASVKLNGTKTIDGNTPKDQEFAFSLYKASKNEKSGDFERGDRIETVRNNGEGNFRFSTITYSKAGTYYYIILEEDPSQDDKGHETGIKKNTQKYLVTVVVQKNNDGSITAKAPSYQEMASTNGESTKTSTSAAFQNTTEKSEGSISLSAKKELKGRALKAGEFTFELVAADQFGRPITENGKEVILQSVKNGVKKADGSNNIQFKEITYKKDLYRGIDQSGRTYYYIVREKQGTDSHIKYTKDTYLVTVKVTDSKTDGKLEVEKSIQLLSDGTSNKTAKATNKSNIEFVNTYSASGSITISGKKTVNGKSIDDQAQSISGAKNQVFTFCLDQMTGDGVKASEKSDGLHLTAKTNASGRFTFGKGKISYTLNDVGKTYYYKLSEDTSNLQAGYSKDFDDQYISVKVAKSDKDDGTLKLTISSKTYDKDGKAKKSEGTTINATGADYTYDAGYLNNKYAASTSVKLHGNKTINGQKPSKDVTDKFSFKLSLLEWTDASGSVHTQKDDTYRQTMKTDNYSQTVKTDKDGSFTFKPLEFNLDDEHNQIGTYKYQIEEVDVPEGYSVNTSAQIVIVKIEDNGKGQLVATMPDENGKAIKADPEKNSYIVKGYTFDNTYKAAGYYAFYGQKVLTGRSLKENEFSFKVVELINKDGKTTEQKVATAKNTADGSLVFDYGTNPDGSIKTGIDYSLDHVGTHTYKITEDKTTLGGIKENKEAYFLTVDVKDNDKGALDVKTTSMKKQKDGKDVDGSLIQNPSQEQLVKEIVFHNVYKARGSISITGIKQMLGRKLNDWDKENVYFNMFIYGIYHRDTGKWEYPKDQSPIYQGGLKDISQDGQTATIAFGHYEMRDGKQVLVEEPITYTEKDANNVYIYRFSENIRGLENDQTKHGVTMDGSMGQAIVDIKDNGDGTLSVQEDSDFQGEHDTTKQPIKNTYHASGELNLSGTKELIGKDLKQGDFSFILRQTDKDGKELTDGYRETVSNAAPSTDIVAKANGPAAGFAFRTIRYTEADAGKDFYYTVSELAGDQAGIKYASDVYQIHVKVTDNGDGTLKVERKDDVKQISFINFYNASASLNLNLIKTINGKTVNESHVANLEDKKFTFTLTEMDGKGEKASPKKYGKTETITVSGKDGKASFSPLSYTLADKDQTYYYRIAEDASKMPKGFAKDGKDFYFSITVSDDGSGLLHLTSDSDVLNDGMDGNTFTAEYALGHTFNNTYSASGELPVKGNKTINGLSPDKDVKDLFAFTLTEISVNGVPVEKPYTETVKTDKDGKFSFSSLKYSMNPDIANSPSGSVQYIYKIEETSYPKGYTKDTDPEYLEVTVSDHGDGTLSIQSTEPKAGYTFNNLYDAKGSITLKGKKTLHGRDMVADEFHFTVTETDDKGTALKVKNAEGKEVDKVVARGSNAAASAEQDADITFSSISYSDKSQVGKHFYTITEDPVDTDKGLSQNTEAYKVVVDVSDNGYGTLKAEAVSGTDKNGDAIDPEKGIHFINTYTAEGSITLKGSKTLIGRDMEAGEFSFSVREKNKDGSYKKAADGTDLIVATGKNQAAKNGQAAAIDFTKISYKDITEIGTHTYEITEDPFQGAAEDGSKDGLQANTQRYIVQVEVSDNGYGTLKAEAISGTNQDGQTITPDRGIAFTNTYKASGTITLNGSKKLTGRDMEADEFHFTVTETDDKGNPLKVKDADGNTVDKVVARGSNAAASKDQAAAITFDPITYDSVDAVGTHTYVITEDASKQAGVAVNRQSYRVKVEVSDNGDGTLKAEAVSATDQNGHTITPASGIVFTNNYKAYGSLDLLGTKTLEGRQLTTQDNFRFVVEEETRDTEGNVNRRQVSSAKLTQQSIAEDKQSAKLVFDRIKYTLADVGTHTYKIHEVIPEAAEKIAGITYDTGEYTLVVTVSDKGDGTLTVETRDAAGNKVDVTKADTYSFKNSYAANGEFTLTGSKTLVGRDMKDGEFTFTVREQNRDGSYKKAIDGTDLIVATGKNKAAKNGQTAAIDFTKIIYKDITDIGTHTYVVTEDPFQGAAEDGSKNGLQANTQKYIVKVDVTDNGYGTLKAEAISGTDADGETIDPEKGIHFINTYSAKGSITLKGSKTLIGRDMKAGEFSFSVREKNEDGSYKKDADGNDIIVATGKNQDAKDGETKDILFSTITYDYDGKDTSVIRDHTYVVTENSWISSDEAEEGLQPNTQKFTVTVQVRDNGDGTLSTKVKEKNSQDIAFVNHYNAEGEFTLTGTKTLTGRNMTAGEFHFIVREKDADGNFKKDADGKDLIVATGTNQAAEDGQAAPIDFTKITYKYDGTDKSVLAARNYVVTELAPSQKGVAANTQEFNVRVLLSDNGHGKINTNVDTDVSDTVAFTNSYSAETEITLKGSKTLVGRDMKDGEFHFTVKELDANSQPMKDAEGNDIIVTTGSNAAAEQGVAADINFGAITYKYTGTNKDVLGDHTYLITEDSFQGAAEDGSKDGLQANRQSFKVVVRVTDDGQGNLTASAISGTDADGENINPATGIAFINTYEASGDHSFYGTKTVAGRDLTPGEDYQFQVEEVIKDEDGKENRVEVSTGHLNPETIVGNHGDILFGTLHYTLADVGTHTYKIHEVIPADQDKTAGITYDKTEYTEIVTVSDKGDGSLEVVAKDADGNLINSGETKTYNFTNKYQNVAVRFTGNKTLIGADIASYPGAFRFDLVDSNGQVIDTAKNDATGRFTFAPIYYEASDVGEHTYTIVEENAGRIINGIKYDDSKIPVTVTVENRAGKLVATGQVKGDEIAFHNEKLSEITVQKNWADDHNAANARPQQITIDLLQNGQVVRSAVLTGATDTWTYTFKDLTPGTYQVRERSDSPYYEVSYDKQILDLTDENGQAKDETVTITNTFERTVDLVAYKDLMGQALNDGQFRFVLHRNSDGDDTSHDLTTTNRGNGSISFYNVTYDPNGYTMYEVAEQSKYPHITFDEHNSIATGLRFDPEGNPITQEDGTALDTFKNVYRPIVLRVQKRSKSAPFDPLVGATYGLYRYSADGNDVLVEAQLSDSNGYMYYGKIEPGVIYYFKEISAPAGHEVDPYAGKHFQVKYTENGNIAVYDEDGNPDTTYGDITSMEDKTEGYRTTEIIKEKDSLDEIQANEKQSRYAYTGNGVNAVAIADKGAFPEGTTMVVTPLTGDRLAEVETLLENNVGQFNTMAFYDITFTDADGKEVEPAFGDVDVTIQPEVGLDTKGIELKNLKLIHLIDDGDPESTVKTVSLVTGSIAAEEKDGEEKLTQTKITSKSFSVFGLIDPKDSTLGNNYLLTANGVGDFVSKLKVAKLDTAGNFIPNATLDVYTFDPKKKDGIGEHVIRWTTAEGCQYLQRILNVDTPYVLVETNAPDGYAIADNIIFSIGQYDSSITCYTLKDGKLTASEKETQLHTNGSELIMVDDPIMVTTNYKTKVIPNHKSRTEDKVLYVPGSPKTGEIPVSMPIALPLASMLALILILSGYYVRKKKKAEK